ncbi:AKAP5-like protein [Mya arenaria]|uniref:AKAP5-like protein n=1 Tax=Mya arenaria TaxID=6604 RepID=A0ABY7F328_MYAAR|nr:AKAP5-like protein [Mya arenaria]
MADMSVCVVGIPYHVLDLTWILTYTHTPVCKLLSFLVSSCTLSSIFILLVVGLDRYLKVCRPLKYQIRDFGDRKACLIAVVLATISSIPNGFLYGTSSVYEYMKSYNITGVECFIDDAYLDSPLGIGYMGYKMLLFLLSVGFLVVIYGLIGRTIYQHDRMAITLERSAYRCFCCRVDNDNDDDMDYCEDGNDLDEIRMSALDVKNNTVRRSTEHLMDNDLDDLDGDASKHSPDASKISPDTSSKPINKKHGQSIVKQSKDKKDKHKKQLRETMIRHSPPGQKAKEKTTRKITLMMMTITTAVEGRLEATVGCTLAASVGCTLEAAVGCSLEATVECTLEATVGCTLEATVGCTLEAAVGCTLEAAVGCTLEATVGCTLEAAVECTLVATVGCTLEASVGGTMEDTVKYTLEAKVKYILEAAVKCTLEATVECTLEAAVGCTLETVFG